MEKLWKKIKQHETHLHYFPSSAALTGKVEQALLKLSTNAPGVFLRSAAYQPNWLRLLKSMCQTIFFLKTDINLSCAGFGVICARNPYQ